MLNLSVIILTKNEELHIERCLKNVSPIAKEIFIIDSFSTDKTLEIALKYPNVKILQNKWINYATQFNWALDNAPIQTEWVLRLDADEYLTVELQKELVEKLPHESNETSGIVFPLRRVFLGRIIRRGMPQIKLLRLFKYGKARSEIRLMDEHIQVQEGKIVEYSNEFADDNLNNLSWWTQKHVGYAIREAADLLNIEFNLSGNVIEGETRLSHQADSKRHKKYIYASKPLYWRSFIYFCYRYFFKLGFLEGKEGFLWHFLQGWWYRTLVDAKVMEIKRKSQCDPAKIKHILAEDYQIYI